MSFIIPAALAGIGAATLCADQIKSAVSPPTISIDAMNATNLKTAPGGRTAKTSAITVQVFAKIHASLTLSCLLRAAIKKHLSFNAHALPTTTPKDLSGEMATKSMVYVLSLAKITTTAGTPPGKNLGNIEPVTPIAAAITNLP